MPIASCQRNGKPGKRWGGRGTCYTGTGASAQAARQAAAARANGFEGHCDCCGGRCAHRGRPLFSKRTSPSSPAFPASFAEGITILGVEVFAAGKHREKNYTDAHLDEMVANFQRFSSPGKTALRVPAVIGHDEDQELLDRSDLPAAAWVTRLYRVGHTLKADFADVAPQIARLIRAKRYRTVSAEIYDEPPQGLAGGRGKTLRRIALLGGEIPQVKSLADIPMPEEHAESGGTCWAPVILRLIRATQHSSGAYTCFSEVRPMNRDDMLKQMAEYGMDPSKFKDCPDEALAEVLKSAKPDEEEAEDDAVPQPPDSYSDDEVKAMPDAQRKEVYSARRSYHEKMMARYSDGEAPVPAKKPEPAAMSDKAVRSIVKSAVAEAVSQVRREFAPLRSDVTRFKEETRREGLQAFCEARLRQGKILPCEMDRAGGQPNLLDRLMTLDDTREVFKFSEGGREIKKTQLQAELDAIDARTPHLFGERFKDPHKGRADGKLDKNARSERIWERFSEDFKKTGAAQTIEELQAGWEKLPQDQFDKVCGEFEQLAGFAA